MNRGWTDFDQDRLEKMWADGMTSSQIAEATGRTRSAIMGRVHRCGLRRPRPTAEQVKASLAEHLSHGRTISQISNRLGITKSHCYAVFAQVKDDLGWQAV